MEVATKIASRGWERDRESRTRVASVVANASHEVDRECESRMGGCECESRNGVAKVKKSGRM